MGKSKITNTFLYALAVISIIGFLGIIGNVWFDFSFITDNAASLILIVLGFGLIAESQIRKWKDMPKGGISSNELSHIVTGIVGLLAIFVGILTLIGFSGSTLLATQGIISVIAIIVIILETWVVD